MSLFIKKIYIFIRILEHNHLHEALWLMHKTGMEQRYDSWFFSVYLRLSVSVSYLSHSLSFPVLSCAKLSKKHRHAFLLSLLFCLYTWLMHHSLFQVPIYFLLFRSCTRTFINLSLYRLQRIFLF